LRRGLAILMVVSVSRSSFALAQPNPALPDAGLAAEQPQSLPLVPSTAQAREVPRNPLSEVPVVTWVCGGLAAALFGVAIGFGASAADIDHRAGVNISPMGVDLGLTRKTALAGRTDATVANGLFIGAGVVALVGLAFAAFNPEPASRWQAPGNSP
jgi:hypothetical protein